MDEQKQKLIERIRQAQNILVTVSTNPTVDQLSAAIGLTLALNKLDKHGTAVFSGQIPSTIEFLKPEETLEKNTDSLRDFIIALDKSKADKLRYKVEDQVVRIFITPYKTSLSEHDLDFSQGDFNVDVVVALGVSEQQDLDAAITAHGRILHDATVASVSTTGQGSLGTINWVDPKASSLSEMMATLVDGLDKKILDNQIATALLTGIVASTERFSNEKTTPRTMSASSVLMAAGANQQLIATELETPPVLPEPPADQLDQYADSIVEKPHKRDPGTLEIDHDAKLPPIDQPEPQPEPEPAPEPQIHVDDDGQLLTEPEMPLPQISQVHGVDVGGHPDDGTPPEVKRERLTEPPKLGNAQMTANAKDEDDLDPSTEELTLPAVSSPLLSHNESVLQPPVEPAMPSKPADPFIPQAPLRPAPPSWQSPVPPAAPEYAAAEPALSAAPVSTPSYTPPVPATPSVRPAVTPPNVPPAPLPTPIYPDPADDETLTEIEKSVDSPHVHIDEQGNLSNTATPSARPVANVDDARSAVEAALNNASTAGGAVQPIAALHAQPLGPELHPTMSGPSTSLPPAPVVTNTGFSEPTPGNTPADDAMDMPLPSNPFGPGQQVTAMPANPLMSGQQPTSATTPPPPVPPPMLPPLQ